MSMDGKWGCSVDGETYYGSFDTPEKAVACGGEVCSVGQYRDPAPPESVVDSMDIIEKVISHDDYANDWGGGALDCTSRQAEELTEAIKRVFGEWIDKHGLRPSFGLVVTTLDVVDGKVIYPNS